MTAPSTSGPTVGSQPVAEVVVHVLGAMAALLSANGWPAAPRDGGGGRGEPRGDVHHGCVERDPGAERRVGRPGGGRPGNGQPASVGRVPSPIGGRSNSGGLSGAGPGRSGSGVGRPVRFTPALGSGRFGRCRPSCRRAAVPGCRNDLGGAPTILASGGPMGRRGGRHSDDCSTTGPLAGATGDGHRPGVPSTG